MVTELLFGETFAILEENENWLLIKNTFDGYESWIDKNQNTPLSQAEFESINASPKFFTYRTISKVENTRTGIVYPIVKGSSVPDLKPDNTFRIGEDEFLLEFEEVDNRAKNAPREMISEFALTYLNSPYLWGGRSPFGIDCSGFAQMVFKYAGIPILRDANQQAEHGQTINFTEECMPGDLAFFDNEDGKIVHVGIVLHENYIIHASGKVKMGKLDQQGIFDLKENKYTHKLRIIKRYI